MEPDYPPSPPTFHNPGQYLDYRRFSSDSLLECYLAENRIIKSHTPDIPVTTNFMPLEYFKWARHMDVISLDNYPPPVPGYFPGWAAFNHDLMRGLKNGKPFIVMEQAANNVNWRAVEFYQLPSVDLNYLDQIRRYYDPLYDMNVPVDIISVDSDFAGYKIIIAPVLYYGKIGACRKAQAIRCEWRCSYYDIFFPV